MTSSSRYSILLLIFVYGSNANKPYIKYTPVKINFKTACLAENLQATDRYTCDSNGNVACLPGWSDPATLCSVPLCNTRVSPMNNNPFSINTLTIMKGCVHGKCVLPNVCFCDVGWFGTYCDKCIPRTDCKHGTCNTPKDCICKSGWKGKNCDQAECRSTCINGGCLEPNVCECKAGWTGPNCDECILLPGCKEGVCFGPYECRCKPGWTGFNCHIPLCPGCNTDNGKCVEPGLCRCYPGWQGPTCETCVKYPDNCERGYCTKPYECLYPNNMPSTD